MTKLDERLDRFVGLALEAVEKAAGAECPALEVVLRERLAQGVQAWALDAEADVRAATLEAYYDAAEVCESSVRDLGPPEWPGYVEFTAAKLGACAAIMRARGRMGRP